MEQILELFKNQIMYIATAEGDQPHVRPFGQLTEQEGNLYINTGKWKRVYRQMKENPKVELCVFAKGKVARVTAKAVETDNDALRWKVLASQPGVANMYAGKEEMLALFRLTDIKAVVTERGTEILRITPAASNGTDSIN